MLEKIFEQDFNYKELPTISLDQRVYSLPTIMSLKPTFIPFRTKNKEVTRFEIFFNKGLTADGIFEALCVIAPSALISDPSRAAQAAQFDIQDIIADPALYQQHKLPDFNNIFEVELRKLLSYFDTGRLSSVSYYYYDDLFNDKRTNSQIFELAKRRLKDNKKEELSYSSQNDTFQLFADPANSSHWCMVYKNSYVLDYLVPYTVCKRELDPLEMHTAMSTIFGFVENIHYSSTKSIVPVLIADVEKNKVSIVPYSHSPHTARLADELTKQTILPMFVKKHYTPRMDYNQSTPSAFLGSAFVGMFDNVFRGKLTQYDQLDFRGRPKEFGKQYSTSHQFQDMIPFQTAYLSYLLLNRDNMIGGPADRFPIFKTLLEQCLSFK